MYFKTSCKLNATGQRWVNDFVKAPFDGAVNQSFNNTTCVPAVKQIFANISEVECQLQYNSGEKQMVLTQKDVFQNQIKQSWIKKLMQVKEGNIDPENLGESREHRNVKLMLRDLDELKVGKNVFFANMVFFTKLSETINDQYCHKSSSC